MRPFLFLFFVFCLISTSGYSQLYKPVDTINKKRDELIKYFGERTKELEADFNSFVVKDKKTIKSFVNERKQMFDELTKGNYLFFDKELEEYLNDLLQNIAKKNGIKNSQKLKIFISRDTSPNAYSLGDGNFVFTLSLLENLDNEEELCFVIAHELSHYDLGHLHKRMTESMKLVSSTEYKTQQKQIKKSKYQKFSRSLEYYRELQYGNNHVRRKRELEADSLGFIYFGKVVNNTHNAISALFKIDSLSPTEKVNLDLEMMKNHFSTPEMPFDNQWTTGYDFSKYNYQTKGKVDIFGTHKDSLQTHPETTARIDNLKKLLSSDTTIETAPSEKFRKLKEKIHFENLYAHYCMEEYGRGIYLIIQLQNMEGRTEKQNQFYNYMLSLFYQRLAEARKSFTFKKYVDDVDYIHFSKEYTLFLTILDNLRSSELQKLANKYKLN